MKTSITTLITVMMIMCVGSLAGARAQEQSRVLNSDGRGTIKIGDESFKVTSVVVKLIDDHTAEITLISEITIFLKGTWSVKTDKPHDLALEITGGASAGGLEAKGQLSVSDDDKSIVALGIRGQSRTTKRAVSLEFKGQ